METFDNEKQSPSPDGGPLPSLDTPEDFNIYPEDFKEFEEVGRMNARKAGIKEGEGEKVLFYDFGEIEPGIFVSIKTTIGAPPPPPTITAKEAPKVEYPLDKANANIWNRIPANEGAVQMVFETGKAKNGKRAEILFSIDFDKLKNVEITKELTAFDKRCYIAAAALFNAGNEIVTASQIYAEMGYTDKPNADDVKKVNDSLTKMGAAQVYIDNKPEAEATKHKHFKYDAPLLPFERITATVNGRLTESAIHLFREPPLITFAKERAQVTTIPRRLLEGPLGKTSGNLQIENYLIERIAHMKAPGQRGFRRISLSTLFEECGVATVKQRQRTPEKIRKYLEHLKKEDWISAFEIDPEGVTITLPGDGEKDGKKGGKK